MMPANAEWYRRNYKDHADWVDGSDPRCWSVIAALGAIYNVTSSDMPDGGLRRCADGLQMFVRSDVASWDGDEMTQLVIAAHKHLCRVSISAADIYGVPANPFNWESRLDRVISGREFDWPDMEVSPGLATGCDYQDKHRADGRCGENLVRASLDSPWTHEFAHEWPDDERYAHEPVPADEIPVYPMSNYLLLMVHPREGAYTRGTSGMTHHPDLEYLQARIAKEVQA